MRTIASATLALLFVACTGFAGVITDPFNQSQAGCNYSLTSPFSNCDVIGSELLFDIQKISVTVSNSLLDAVIYTNYGGGSSLGPFTPPGTPTKLPGDLFFYDPADPTTSHYDSALSYPEFKFGVPLTNHDGLTAGDLYQILNFNALQTAQQILDPTNTQWQGLFFRRTEPTWMPGGEPLAGNGTITVTNYGDGTTNAQFAIEVKVPNPSAAFLALISGGQIGIGFSSATCANDVLTGLVPVPEPGSFVLLTAGIGLIGFGAWRRRRLN
jgi:hypothetical protein